MYFLFVVLNQIIMAEKSFIEKRGLFCFACNFSLWCIQGHSSIWDLDAAKHSQQAALYVEKLSPKQTSALWKIHFWGQVLAMKSCCRAPELLNMSEFLNSSAGRDVCTLPVSSCSLINNDILLLTVMDYRWHAGLKVWSFDCQPWAEVKN